MLIKLLVPYATRLESFTSHGHKISSESFRECWALAAEEGKSDAGPRLFGGPETNNRLPAFLPFETPCLVMPDCPWEVWLLVLVCQNVQDSQHRGPCATFSLRSLLSFSLWLALVLSNASPASLLESSQFFFSSLQSLSFSL